MLHYLLSHKAQYERRSNNDITSQTGKTQVVTFASSLVARSGKERNRNIVYNGLFVCHSNVIFTKFLIGEIKKDSGEKT